MPGIDPRFVIALQFLEFGDGLHALVSGLDINIVQIFNLTGETRLSGLQGIKFLVLFESQKFFFRIFELFLNFVQLIAHPAQGAAG